MKDQCRIKYPRSIGAGSALVTMQYQIEESPKYLRKIEVALTKQLCSNEFIIVIPHRYNTILLREFE